MSNLGDVLRQVVSAPSQIPYDWKFLKLTEVCNPKQWRTIASNEMTTSGYPVFGANGFVGFYHEYNHEDETIAITCRGNTCGTINRVPPKTYITGNSMALDDVKGGVVNQDYLYYALKYRGVGDSISGSAQPQITGAGLKPIEFPAPPLLEQQKIAAILSSVDDVIGKTRAQIDKLKDLKTGMMQELLTKGIGHTEFKDSPMGLIPVGWKVQELQDIGECVRGLTYSPDDIVENGLLVLRSSNIVDGGLVFEDTVKVKVDIENKFKSRAGDILICVRNGSKPLIGKSATIPKSMHATHGAFMTVFRTKQFRYVQHLIKSDLFFRSVSRDIGATINSINNGNLLKYQFPIPSAQEQEKIDNILSSIDKKIFIQKNRLESLESQKKALMQDLLTGKVRVKTNQKESAVA